MSQFRTVLGSLVLGLVLGISISAVGQKGNATVQPQGVGAAKKAIADLVDIHRRVVVNHEEQIKLVEGLRTHAALLQAQLSRIQDLAQGFKSKKNSLTDLLGAIEKTRSNKTRLIGGLAAEFKKNDEAFRTLQKAAESRHDTAKGIIGNIRA